MLWGLKKYSFTDETVRGSPCSAGYYPGDPFCNDANNNAECNYDEGACCDGQSLPWPWSQVWDHFCTVRNHLISSLFKTAQEFCISEKKINIDLSSLFARIVSVWTQKDPKMQGLQNYPQFTLYLKSWVVSFRFVRRHPLCFCDFL